jgi:CheY-like chemotaxis protein
MKKFTVFILDDDAMFCQLLVAVIKQKHFTQRIPNYKIILTTYYDIDNIPGAINWIRDNKPDLVLLDYMLGTASEACLVSLDVLEKIIPYCADIKILTGLYKEDARRKLVEENLDKMDMDIIQKPFGTDKLQQIFTDAIDKKENAERN